MCCKLVKSTLKEINEESKKKITKLQNVSDIQLGE